MDKKDNKATCMTCSCPCDMHQEHTHPVSGENKDGAGVCRMCGHGHKADGSCDCGCK